jgi:hypothetical protein
MNTAAFHQFLWKAKDCCLPGGQEGNITSNFWLEGGFSRFFRNSCTYVLIYMTFLLREDHAVNIHRWENLESHNSLGAVSESPCMCFPYVPPCRANVLKFLSKSLQCNTKAEALSSLVWVPSQFPLNFNVLSGDWISRSAEWLGHGLEARAVGVWILAKQRIFYRILTIVVTIRLTGFPDFVF